VELSPPHYQTTKYDAKIGHEKKSIYSCPTLLAVTNCKHRTLVVLPQVMGSSLLRMLSKILHEIVHARREGGGKPVTRVMVVFVRQRDEIERLVVLLQHLNEVD